LYSSNEEFLRIREDALEEEQLVNKVPNTGMEKLNEVYLAEIQPICITFWSEQAHFVKEMKVQFFKSWSEVNIGEQMMRSYITFATERRQPPMEWLQRRVLQSRQQYLGSVCSLELLRGVPAGCLAAALRRTLHLLLTLPYIVTFNQRTAEEQLAWAPPRIDRLQWQDRPGNIGGVSAQLLLQCLPCLDTTKAKVARQLYNHKGKVFTDRCIHMIMVVLLLFDGEDEDRRMRAVHQASLHLLRAHLEVHSKEPERVLQQVLRCVKALPRIHQLLMNVNCQLQALRL